MSQQGDPVEFGCHLVLTLPELDVWSLLLFPQFHSDTLLGSLLPSWPLLLSLLYGDSKGAGFFKTDPPPPLSLARLAHLTMDEPYFRSPFFPLCARLEHLFGCPGNRSFSETYQTWWGRAEFGIPPASAPPRLRMLKPSSRPARGRSISLGACVPATPN